jgi:hypothetical protein
MRGTAATAKQGIPRTPTSAVNLLQVFLLTSVVWLAIFNGGSAMCAMRPEHEAEHKQWLEDKARDLQRSAPEILDLKIISVDITPPVEDPEMKHPRVAETLAVHAQVTDVERSNSNLQPGAHISIHYQVWQYAKGAVGGNIHNPLTLKPKDCVRAYLQPSDDIPNESKAYVIAADILSFEPCSPGASSLFRQLQKWWSS